MSRLPFASWLIPVPVLLLAAAFVRLPESPSLAASAPAPPAADVDRSPADLALLPGGKLLLTANQTADSVSLVDLVAGKVVAEMPVGKRPFDVAVTPDGKQAVVTNSWSNSVTVLDVTAGGLKTVKNIPVGDEPRGIAVTKDGGRAFVALAGQEEVAVLDLKTRTVTKRLPVDWEPWHVALTPDGSRLAVGNSRARTLTVLDTKTGATLFTTKTLGRNLRHIAVDPTGEWAYMPSISERGLGVSTFNIDRGWVVGNRLTRIRLTEAAPREAITLDTPGDAVADVDGATISPDGKTIALTCGGTHELLLMRLTDLPFIAYGGPGDHIDPTLRGDEERFRRIPLGGRPLGASFTADGKSVVVANYLSNAVQVVDVATGKVTKTVALGGPATPSLARRGEAIFHDGKRSFNNWYSCGTCHTEGHTNGGSFDTLNDGGYGRPKKTLSLRGIAETSPYTWHGWQKELPASIRESLVSTMQGPKPTDEDVAALEAYFKTLTFRPNPNRNPDGTLTVAAKRGEAVFKAKGCNSCHTGTNYTSPIVVKAGLEETGDRFEGYNPPPLRGVYARAPYLHDGRSKTLEEVLTEDHLPSKLTGQKDCTPTELADLVAFLKSL
jgi:YVTN family beta-propeller protein